ncbi:MAG: DNA repair protein RadA [Lachnospiraceae bacterium]|nr:DNA repair protein RadA [Lachnospiraceae bacterium]
MAPKQKKKTVFVCQNCGYESAKWVGNCPACHEWNSLVEESVKAEIKTSSPSAAMSARLKQGERKKPLPLSEIEGSDENRVKSGFPELDRVLGGGVVKGSMVLVGGDPGIGKSTLLLQLCRNLSLSGHEILYVSGEESLKQIKMRAARLGEFGGSLKILSETDLDEISDVIDGYKPEFVVIDSIQTMFNESVGAAPGSVSQIRETTAVLLRIAKDLGISIFIIGHVTKEGAVAGPRVLEHMVDTVLYFEGDTKGAYRILRSVKNRFGSTDEIGVFEMDEGGLHEVENPSEFLLSGRPENAGGSVVSCCMEGTRPLLIEIQALVCETAFGFPRRQASGTDINKVNLLMAVLEKRLSMKLSSLDAYVNIAGGIKVNEPALDLAIVLAIASSYKNRPVGQNVAAFGEVGLSGEVRSVTQTMQRINEAARLGFEKIFIPQASLKNVRAADNIKIIGVKNVGELLGQ